MINLFPKYICIDVAVCVNLQLDVTRMQYVNRTFLQITFLFFTLSEFLAQFPKQKKVLYSCLNRFIFNCINIHYFDILGFFCLVCQEVKDELSRRFQNM